MFERLLNLLLKLFWEVAAVSVIAAAVLVTIGRFMLPHVSNYRPEIEALIAEYTAQPVVIQEISADWRGWTPNLHLTNIELLDSSRRRTLTRFERASLSIDLLASLVQRQIVPGRLTVSGVQLALLRSADGKIKIEGVAPESSELPSVRQNALAYWLENQKNLVVESARITWLDKKSLLQPVIFSNVRLAIRSDGERHQLEGSARLPEEIGEAFDFVLDAEGDLLTTDWSGQIYVEAKGVDPTVLLNYQSWLGLKLERGKLDFQVWSQWDEARLSSMDGRFGMQGVELGVGESRFKVKSAGGNLSAVREGESRWRLGLSQLAIATQNGDWPETELGLMIVPHAGDAIPTVVGSASFVRLDDLVPLVPGITAVPEPIVRTLAEIQPRGELHDLRIGYFPLRPPAERFYVHTRFSDVVVKRYRRFPGVNGLKGSFKASAAGGRLELTSTYLQFLPTERFEEPLWFSEVSGAIRWTPSETGWQFTTEGFHLRNDLASMNVSGSVDVLPDRSPELNLLAELDAGDLEHLPEVLPKGAMPARGYAWIQSAIHGGHIDSGMAVLRGPADRFPFDQQEGVFKVRLVTSDALVQFRPDWPRLEDVEAEILFEGRRLTVNAASAKMLNIRLSDLSISVPDLLVRRRQLSAHGLVHADAAAARQVIAASPLQQTLGKQLEHLAIDGDLQVDLQLDLALVRGAKAQSSGTLRLLDDAVRDARFNIALEHVNGSLAFARKHWSADDVEAQYMSRPVVLNLDGELDNPDGVNHYRMSGTADRDLIVQNLSRFAPALAQRFADYRLDEAIDGEAAWSATLTVGNEQARPLPPRRLEIASDLRGLAIALPAPIGKEAQDPAELRLDATTQASGLTRVALDYGQDVHVSLLTERAPNGARSLRGAAVSFGSEPATLVDSQLLLTGELSYLPVSAWHRALGAGRRRSSGGPVLPAHLNLEVRELAYLGYRFSDLMLSGTRTADGWKLRLSGPDLDGEVLLPFRPGSGRPIEAEFERLRIADRTDTAAETLDPARVPALLISCSDFAFNGIDLGAMKLRTRPGRDGLHLEELRFSTEEMEITALGEWTKTDSQKSRFDIAVRSEDLSDLLGRFGYDVTAVEGGDTELDIHASWDGTPADFSLAQLDGEMRLKIDEGRFLDIDPKAGRLFGLLSMQSIRRRIVLDFDDLFKRGLAFDRIEGLFELDQGNAYTNNLSMDGPSARVEVSGRTGLVEQDYDQIITITPQLANSLPVASALFGPAGAGVGAVLYLGQKVFKAIPEQIDRMLSRQYFVTGSWDSPNVERVKGSEATLGG